MVQAVRSSLSKAMVIGYTENGEQDKELSSVKIPSSGAETIAGAE